MNYTLFVFFSEKKELPGGHFALYNNKKTFYLLAFLLGIWRVYTFKRGSGMFIVARTSGYNSRSWLAGSCYRLV